MMTTSRGIIQGASVVASAVRTSAGDGVHFDGSTATWAMSWVRSVFADTTASTVHGIARSAVSTSAAALLLYALLCACFADPVSPPPEGADSTRLKLSDQRLVPYAMEYLLHG